MVKIINHVVGSRLLECGSQPDEIFLFPVLWAWQPGNLATWQTQTGKLATPLSLHSEAQRLLDGGDGRGSVSNLSISSIQRFGHQSEI